MTLYRISRWDEDFETSQSRSIRWPAFVAMPIVTGGRRFQRLKQVAGPLDAMTELGLLYALAAWQMRLDPRGRDGYLTADGTAAEDPMDAGDVASLLGFDADAVGVALEDLCEVGFLEALEAPGERGRGDYRGVGGRGSAPRTRDGTKDGGTEGRDLRAGACAGDAGGRVSAPLRPRAPRGATDRPTDALEARPPAGGTPSTDGQARAPRGETDGRKTTASSGLRPADGRQDGTTGHEQIAPGSCCFDIEAAKNITVRLVDDSMGRLDDDAVARLAAAFPRLDIEAAMRAMAIWADDQVAYGQRDKLWRREDFFRHVTRWCAEEATKPWKEVPKGAPRGAAGKPIGSYERTIEALDKSKRAMRERINKIKADIEVVKSKLGAYGDDPVNSARLARDKAQVKELEQLCDQADRAATEATRKHLEEA